MTPPHPPPSPLLTLTRVPSPAPPLLTLIPWPRTSRRPSPRALSVPRCRQARLLHVIGIIWVQLVMYDRLKVALGLPATGGH